MDLFNFKNNFSNTNNKAAVSEPRGYSDTGKTSRLSDKSRFRYRA